MRWEQGERREAAGPDAVGSAARDGRAGLALFPTASLLPAPFFLSVSPSRSAVSFFPSLSHFPLSAPLFPPPISHFSSVSLICSCSPPFSFTPLFSLFLSHFSFALSRFNCPHSPSFSFHFFSSVSLISPISLPHFLSVSIFPLVSLLFLSVFLLFPFHCFSLGLPHIFPMVSLIFFPFLSFPPHFLSFSPHSPSFPPQFLFSLQNPMLSLIFSLSLIFFQFLSFSPTLSHFPLSFSHLPSHFLSFSPSISHFSS